MRSYQPFQTLLAGAAILALGAAAAHAAGAFPPDVRGAWKVAGEAIVAGVAPFHPPGSQPAAEGSKPRLRTFAGSWNVTGQDGARFWGATENQDATDPFIGSFTGKGQEFTGADTDGFFDGEVLSDGTIRYCYRHTTAKSQVVSCGTMTK